MITNPVKLDPHCFSLSSTTLSLALVNHSLSVMSSMQIKSNQRVPCWRHQPGCSAGCSASPRRCHTQKEPTQKHAASCPTGRQTHPRCLSSELAETHTSLVSQLSSLETSPTLTPMKSTWGDRRRERSGS